MLRAAVAPSHLRARGSMVAVTNPEADRAFEIVGATLPGWPDPAVAIAASRAGATGLLNLEHTTDLAAARSALARLGSFGRGSLGVKVRPGGGTSGDLAAHLPPAINLVVVAGADALSARSAIALVRAPGRRVLLECTSVEEARAALESGADGLVAKGHEAGGHVGEETTFILLQRLLRETDRPVLAYGGIGLHSAPAAYVAGCSGVVVDAQLALARESALPPRLRAALERMEGDETLCVGAEIGDLYRVYQRPGMAALDALPQVEATLAAQPAGAARDRWRAAIQARVGWERPEAQLWPLGQDGAFAARLARRFHTVAGILDGLRASVVDHVRLARGQRALDRGAPLARSHGTEYPILQGPMTRVSDTAAFAEAVARGGALPFLALALLRGPQVRALLQETGERLGDRPWGVGILGLVPLELRQEQLEVIHDFRPPFAIIAGGRPDQAARLEANGIATYLHVPAPGLLRMFVEDGARRFIFEGRECGGHVGPRTSFVLWQTMIDALLDALEAGIPADHLHVVFAGGVHDDRSAAMVAAMAAPLVERGARIGVLLGTGYLFTEEAVAAGAIVEGFQREALGCAHTVLLETGPGHSTRCVDTPFYETFREAKRRLLAEGKSPEELRRELEALNLGRVRIASKGIARDGEAEGNGPRYVEVDPERQHRDGMFMIGQLAALRKGVCRIADLHEGVSRGGARLLAGLALPAGPAPRAVPEAARPCNVAIIGLGCLLPKAPDVPTFWANVLDKVDSRWGGFLDDVPFDPMRYGIPPAALPSIDSLQLLSLEVARQALADAGYLDRDFPRARTSVILGVSGGLGDLGLGYGIRSNLPAVLGRAPAQALERLPEWTEDSFAGILLNVAAGRVANRFDLGGVNYTVDAACASSLAAAYLAVSELEAGTSDMVVVGGVDTVQSPFGFLCFSKSQALSPRGRCRTFDAGADGIAISEGITMLVLKRLADAERDGDRIYAVVKAVAGSSDGRGRSLTAPRPEGQTLALERAYARAGISPATVGLVEAHGTGTVVGDAAEVAALSEVFQAAGAAPSSCAIGSVKSMVGHTKSAAGVTGMMKVALALHHKVLPPTLHVETPNPRLREADNPFFVSTDALPWLPAEPGTPRRAGVSSFGFGGTNFHAVLEEHVDDYTDPMARKTWEAWPAELFVWNGASAAGLEAALAALSTSLERGARPVLRSLAAAVCSAADGGSGNDSRRLAIVATDLDDLRGKLGVAREALKTGRSRLQDPKGVYLASGDRPRGRLAFLFPGQGSQSPHMMRDLALHFPHLRVACEQADRVLRGRLPRRLSGYMHPPSAFGPAEQSAQMQAITDTVVAQPALGAVEVGLLHLLRDLGLEPDMVAGHSYGEYVALAAAGVLSEDALFEISEARGRAIKESVRETPGTMAAVLAPAETVAAALRDLPNVWLANFNAPKQTIIAGAPADLEPAMAVLASAGPRAKPIPVACAFHSPLMERARVRLAAELARLELKPPRIPVFSNTEAGAYPAEPARMAALLSEHLVRPVQFLDEIRAMYDRGARLFVEVGPKSVLTSLVRQILDRPDAAAIPLDVSDRNGLVQLLHALAQLAASGLDVRLGRLFAGRSVGKLELDKLDESRAPSPAWVVSGAGARPAGQAPGRPAPTLPPVPIPAGPRDVAGELLRIVSERTGYPADMLNPDLNLEADLGIDSIKRVEILSAFQRRQSAEDQGRVSGVMERLTGRKTLREAIATLDEALSGASGPVPPAASGGPPPERAPAASPALPDVEEVPRLTLRAVGAPLEKARSGSFSGRAWLITDDEGGLAEAIAARLAQRDERPVILRQQAAVSAQGPARYGADLTRPEQVAAVLDRVRGAHGAPAVLLHLLPLKAGPGFDGLSIDAWRERVQSDIKTLYGLLRAAGDDLTAAGRAGGAMVVAATGLGSSLAGPAAVRSSPAAPAEEKAAQLLAEVGSRDGPVEVGYSGGRRVTVVPRLAPLGNGANGSGGVDVGPDWVFLITGGARGITAEIASYLASTFKPTLVLAGLSPLPEDEAPETAAIGDPQQLKAALAASMRAANAAVKPSEVEVAWQRLLRSREIRRNLDGLRRTGARVEYQPVDVRDEAAFGGLIDGIYRTHGRIDAVIHGAGIIEDKLLRDKTAESFDRVVHTKTDSAFILARRLRPEGLKILIFMSSVTATFGNRGQADYGAANGVLNALATLLSSRWPARVRALNWGPWDRTGMVSEPVKRQFASRGIQVISASAGVAAVAREIEARDSEPIVVGGGPWVADAVRSPELEVTA